MSDKKVSQKIIGIDLGTTNSCVAIMEGDESTIIPNQEGSRTTPSVVAFTDKGEMLVGEPAKRQAVTNPQNTVNSIKRLIGRRYEEEAVEEAKKKISYDLIKDSQGRVKVKVNKGEFLPQEISARVLQKMKQTAEEYLGEKVIRAVITVPAYFSDSQRQATKDAGSIAGLKVERIVNEPTAAAMAYGLEKKGEKKIAVYDLGGGTFDISILDVGDNVVEVLSTNGNTYLGGDDFDQQIADWVAESFKKESGIDIREDKMALQRLKEAAEKAKCELSSSLETGINLPFITADQSGPKHLAMTLTRAKLEQLTENLINRTLGPCEQALKDAKLKPSDIQEVILVGGQTRMPKVQEVVKKLFGREPHKGVNPDEVVAAGAAIQAGVLAGEVKDILLLDVTPLSLGIETLGEVFTKLIERNTTIPTKESKIFTTAADGQTAVDIHVLQGERAMSADNKTLGRFQLTGIPPAPRGVPQIEVTFDIDANGIVNVKAKDKGTGKEQEITIREAGAALSEEEKEKMVRDAEAHAEEDKKKREKIEVQNQADNIIYATEKTLKEHGNKVSDADKKNIQDALEELKKAKDSGTAEEIREKIKKLSEVSQKLGQAVYQEAAKKEAGEQAQKKAEEGKEKKKEKKKKEKKEGEDVTDADYEVEK